MVSWEDHWKVALMDYMFPALPKRIQESNTHQVGDARHSLGRFQKWTSQWRTNHHLRVPGVEPGSTAWKAAMITATPHTHAQSRLPLHTPRPWQSQCWC